VPPVIILDNEFVTVWYHPDTRIVHHQFHKFVYGKVFREALSAGADAMRRYGAQKWLSDDRENSALAQKDLKWADGDWFPRVQAAGWKHWAIVLPGNVLGQMNMEATVKRIASRGVTTRMFSDPLQAMAWLESL
jgi:hypothetical protein